MLPSKIYKRSFLVEAFQATKEAMEKEEDWPEWVFHAYMGNPGKLGTFQALDDADGGSPLAVIGTNGLVYPVNYGDWVIRGPSGEIFAVSDEDIRQDYEPVKTEGVHSDPTTDD